MEEKNKNVLNVLGGFMGDFSKDLYGSVKNFANNVFGDLKKKSAQTTQNMMEEKEDAQFFGNPIMKGLIDIKNQLDQFVIAKEKKEDVHEIIIKEEICNLLNFMIDLRQDFLLSNVLGWYDSLSYKTKNYKEEKKDKLKKLTEEEMSRVLPVTPKTGINDIDKKYHHPWEPRVMSKKGICVDMKKLKQELEIKEKKFIKFTPEAEIPDLDTLFNGVEANINTPTQMILPSLLTTFYLCNNTTLQNKILTVIMRMFNQKRELVDNFDNLDVIFEKRNIAAYYKLEAWTTSLRVLAESSEVQRYV